MTPLQSYLGKPELKAALIAEITKHEQADMIMKGTYGQGEGCGWRGCAIGCSLRSLNKIEGKPEDAATGVHARYLSGLGLPLWFAYCEDNIFENLPDALAVTWPRRCAEAVPVGVDLTRALAALMRWVLIDETYGVVHAVESDDVKAIVQRMGDLFAREVAGELVPGAEFEAAAWAARAAWAAWAARAAWDAWAARDAWDAWAARDAWDAWAARAADGFYPALSEELLRLLREAQ